MWRVSVYIILFLITITIARAEEPNKYERLIIDANRLVSDLHDTWKDHRTFGCIERLVPLDDFQIVLKPKIIKSIKKRELRWYIGVKWTF